MNIARRYDNENQKLKLLKIIVLSEAHVVVGYICYHCEI